MKTLILDESKWRCGLYSIKNNNRRGQGATKLKNNKGFMCCLGMFSEQLAPKTRLLNDPEHELPSDYKLKIPYLSYKKLDRYENTILSIKAVDINDNELTSVEQKVKELRKLFKTKGFRIIFKRIKK